MSNLHIAKENAGISTANTMGESDFATVPSAA
jgi:hypothetical protein